VRILKTITALTFVTVAALAYVHQQVELVKLSYAIDIKEKKMKELVDIREGLKYSIENLESPSRLEKVLLSKNIAIAFPKRAEVVPTKPMKIAGRTDRVRASGIEGKANTFGIFEFFSPRAEAHAKEK